MDGFEAGHSGPVPIPLQQLMQYLEKYFTAQTGRQLILQETMLKRLLIGRLSDYLRKEFWLPT